MHDVWSMTTETHAHTFLPHRDYNLLHSGCSCGWSPAGCHGDSDCMCDGLLYEENGERKTEVHLSITSVHLSVCDVAS